MNARSSKYLQFLLFSLCISLLIGSTSLAQSNAQPIFRSGFESDTLGTGGTIPQDLSGIDNSVSPPNNWVTNLDDDNRIRDFKFFYGCDGEDIAWAKIVDDPTTSQANKVMHFWLKNRCGAGSRVSTSIHPEHALTQVYSKVRLYLHPDLKLLENHIGSGVSSSELNWLMILELWPRHNSEGSQNFRMNINLRREPDTGKFFWRATGEQQSPRINYWEERIKDIEVPFGEWFTSEFYYKMGRANEGRFYYAIQRDGMEKQVIFDVHDITSHPDRPLEGIFVFNPHKLYTDPGNIDYVRGQGGVMQMYWDDWEMWTSMPNSDTSPPTQVTGLTASGISESQISLSWNAASDPESGIASYSIFRDNIIVDSTSVTNFVDKGLNEDSSHLYRVKAVNGIGLTGPDSNTITATTLKDSSAPTVDIISTSDVNTLRIKFSEPVELSSSQNIANYQLNLGATILNAQLLTDLSTVVLTSSTLLENTVYSITVNNIRDRASTPNIIAPNTRVEFSIGSSEADLIGLWKFDSGSGSVAVDSSEVGNDGLISGASWSSDAKIGASSVSFGALSDFVQVGTSGLTTSAGTVAFWVKPRSFNAKNYFFGHTQQGNSYADRIQVYSNNNMLGVGLGDLHSKATNIVELPLHVWTHVALTWSGANYFVYVNGLEVRSGTFASATLAAINSFADFGNNGQGTIGTDHRNQALDGLIDEGYLFSKALSGPEIFSLANPGASSPKLNIFSPTVNQQIVSSVVPVSYATSGDLSEVAHAHLMLDSTIVMDTDFDGFAQFTSVANGDHTLHGWLVTSNHVEIEGSRHTVQFSTVDSDSNPPVLTPLLAAGDLLLSVDTNENAECRYSQTLGSAFGSMVPFVNTGATLHTTSISVTNSADHNFFIKCQDEFGNVNTQDHIISFSIS